MALLLTDVWSNEIAQNIYPDDSFVVHSRNDNAYVDHDFVRLPQSGAKPKSARNRTVFPAAITERIDALVSYQMQWFSTDPTRIRNAEQHALSYAKRKDVAQDHVAVLQQDASEYLLSVWSGNSAATVSVTSGPLRAASAVGATGNRKSLTLADVKTAMTKMDLQNIPRKGRKILLNPIFHSDLLDDTKLTSRDYTPENGGNMMEGKVGMLWGFEVFVRSSVNSYANNSFAPKDPVALPAVDDDAGALIWHPNFVRRAVGTTVVNINTGVAEHYGDILTMEAWAGGTAWYIDRRGSMSIKESK